MKNKLKVSLIAMMLGGVVFVGCSNSNGGTESTTSPNNDTQTKSVKITAVGSTTVQVPMEELANTYKEIKPNVVVEVQGVGSSAGVKAANEKTADIGMVSRALKKEEEEYGLETTEIAFDGIAVMINPANGVESLTTEEIKNIFEGNITNWSEVGGNDQAIIVVTREDGSGTRGAFEEMVGLKEKRDDKEISTITQSALVADGNGTIRAQVASKEGAIGYISLGFLDDTVKAVAVDEVAATVETVKNGTYTISRPLLILTQPNPSEDVAEFVSYILSDEGQEVVSEKYIPVN
ncbi:MAG: phosphate ABC transporter substrate-binding protein PstS family protein [Cellulosilyticaceae bacterium]